jgi:hypothetical protein
MSAKLRQSAALSNLWHGNVVRARERIDKALGFLDDEAKLQQMQWSKKGAHLAREDETGKKIL